MIETKNIPKLRFPEFEGKWATKRLDHVTNKIQDGTHFSPPILLNGEEGYKYITSKNIQKGCMDLTDIQLISKEEHEKIFQRCDVQLNDVLITKDGASTGNTCLNVLDEEFSLLSSVAFIRANEIDTINEFIYQYILSSRGQKIIQAEISGQAITRITLTKLKAFKFNFPLIVEQQKIASFLTVVDYKIQQLTKKKSLLEQYKKGVMQKIFKQEIRFKDDNGREFPEWKEKKLGEIAYITTGSSNREDSILNGSYTFFDRSQDIRTSNIYLFDEETIILAGEGQEFIPKYFIGKFDLHQRTYAIMNFQNSIGKYLFFYIYTNRSYFYSQAVGSTVKSLRLPMFKKMKIHLPCIEEQQKIANFLSAIDNKIEHVNTHLEKTKDFKKGLLQQMFV